MKTGRKQAPAQAIIQVLKAEIEMWRASNTELDGVVRNNEARWNIAALEAAVKIVRLHGKGGAPMKTSSKGPIIRIDRRAARGVIAREARAWRGAMGGIRLTPLGRAYVMPPRAQRRCIGRARHKLRTASDALGCAIAFGNAGFDRPARRCIEIVRENLRASSARLGMLFEDWRAQ